MENSKQYQRYKKQFKTECVFKAAASAVALLTLIFLLFIPCFRISLASSEAEADMMKLLGINPYHDFSIFDEIIQSFKLFGGSSEGAVSSAGSVSMIFSAYQILATVCIIAAIVWFAIDCVRLCVGIVNLDNYSLLAYDEIKSRAGEKRKRRYISPLNFFASGIMLEIFYIVFYKAFPFPTEEGGVSSYFAQMTGVSGAIAVVIIFAVAAIGLLVYDRILKNKIKTAILKEDYYLNAEQRASSESEA